jgi:hypothetical protein
MSTVFGKLNLKDQTEMLVVDAPGSFEPELAGLTGVTVLRDAQAAPQATFVLAFVTTLAEVAAAAQLAAAKTQGDAIVWMAYPKASSKKVRCDFNRDTGWDAVGQAGFEPVRQVAIDEDWSALRFRRVAYIKTMRRPESVALSEQGKARL